MSVAAHLNIPLDEYDARIRTFIPGYDDMLDAGAQALRALPASPRPVIVDLGTGTGAFAERCLRVVRRASLCAIDADVAILELARQRLRKAGVPVEFRNSSFTRAPLPRANAVIASLALPHVKRTADKQALYGRIARALRRGGLLVIGDCFAAADARLARTVLDGWRAHLRATYSAREVARYFAGWANEDRYFTLDRELAMLRASGLRPEVVWRAGPMGVIAARR